MISVVIPAYNAGRFIRQTIDSVLAQTYTHYEIIVVDDGSTDNTGDVVKQNGDKVKYFYQNNAGDGPARNTGINHAKGEWIAFLDHDDEWLPNKLEIQMAMLAKNPRFVWCATDYYQASGARSVVRGKIRRFRDLIQKGDRFENYFLAVKAGGCSSITTSTMMIKKNVFEEIGSFDSCWLRCADMDMWWRIAHRYPEIGYIAKPLTVMHLGLQSGVNTQLVFKDAHGQNARDLVAKHLALARQYGDIEIFQSFASSVLRSILQTTLFHGFKEDARAITRQFYDLFPHYLVTAVYLLTVFPNLTSVCMRGISSIKHTIGFSKQLTRRYSHSEVIAGAERK